MADKLQSELIKRTVSSSPKEEEAPDLDDKKLKKYMVVYMGPDKGPFKCGNCERFSAPNSCSIVEGAVEAEGCCDLFDPKH
jgi:hypothetical protein